MQSGQAQGVSAYKWESDVARSSDNINAGYLEFVVDISSHMTKELEGRTKMEIVKEEVEKALTRLDSLANQRLIHVGIRTIGGPLLYAEPACQNSALAYPVGPIQLSTMTQVLHSLRAQGPAPIAHALRQAVKDFPDDPETTKSIILITDGQESCEKNICQMIWDLSKKIQNLKVHVIGLDLTPQTAQIIACMAHMTGGSMALAADPGRLERGLNDALADFFSSVFPKKKNSVAAKRGKGGSRRYSRAAWKDADAKKETGPYVESPWIVGILSLIVPGAGQIALGEAADASAVLATESSLIFAGSQLRNRYERESKKDFVLPAFYMDIFNAAILSEWVAQSAGAAWTAKKRKAEEDPEFKSPGMAGALSLLWPGLGDVYAGDNVAMGLTMMGTSAFFFSRVVFPLGAHVSVGTKSPLRIQGKSPRPHETEALHDIRRLSLLSFMTLQVGSALSAIGAAMNPASRQEHIEYQRSPWAVGILAGMIPGAGHVVLGKGRSGFHILAAESGALYGLRDWNKYQIKQKDAPRRADLALRDAMAVGAASLWAGQAAAAAMLARDYQREPTAEGKNQADAMALSIIWPGLGCADSRGVPEVCLSAMGLSAYLLYRSIYPFGATRALIYFPPKRIRPSSEERAQYRKVRWIFFSGYAGLGLGTGLISWFAASRPDDDLEGWNFRRKNSKSWTLGLLPYPEGITVSLRLYF